MTWNVLVHQALSPNGSPKLVNRNCWSIFMTSQLWLPEMDGFLWSNTTTGSTASLALTSQCCRHEISSEITSFYQHQYAFVKRGDGWFCHSELLLNWRLANFVLYYNKCVFCLRYMPRQSWQFVIFMVGLFMFLWHYWLSIHICDHYVAFCSTTFEGL